MSRIRHAPQKVMALRSPDRAPATVAMMASSRVRCGGALLLADGGMAATNAAYRANGSSPAGFASASNTTSGIGAITPPWVTSRPAAGHHIMNPLRHGYRYRAQ